MKHPDKELKIIKVTLSQEYAIPMLNNKQTVINNQTIEYVIQEWFKRFTLNDRHVTRDSYHISGSKKVIDIEVER